jgi:hypothetical protein
MTVIMKYGLMKYVKICLKYRMLKLLYCVTQLNKDNDCKSLLVNGWKNVKVLLGQQARPVTMHFLP